MEFMELVTNQPDLSQLLKITQTLQNIYRDEKPNQNISEHVIFAMKLFNSY